MKFKYSSDPNEALFEAVNKGSHADVITFLTQQGNPADPNWIHPSQLVKAGGSNHTILHRAAYLEGHPETIGTRGNQMHITDAILTYAVIPINPELKDRQGNTALHLLAESTKSLDCGAEGNPAVFEKMFQLGFDPALSNNRCSTPYSMLSAHSNRVQKCFQAFFSKREQQERKATGKNTEGAKMKRVEAALKKIEEKKKKAVSKANLKKKQPKKELKKMTTKVGKKNDVKKTKKVGKK